MSDEQAIRRVVMHIEDAWNASDSVAFATAFSTDADFIHILGGHFQGRAAIEGGHRQIWDTIYKGSAVAFEVEGIRFVRPDVAIAFVHSTLTFPGREGAGQTQARPTLILSKDNGLWQIVAFQNTLIGEPRPFEDASAAYPKRQL